MPKGPIAPLAPVVAVLNMKGGVGKTTIAANVMRSVFERGNKSLLVDFDPQLNLTQLLLSPARYETLKAEGKTMLSVMESAPDPSLFKVNNIPGPAPEPEELSVVLRRFVRSPEIDLRLVPGDFGLIKYSLIDESSRQLAPTRARFKDFISTAQKENDVVCIDCNPSSSFMTVSALEVATHVLVPIRPDRFSSLGLKMLHTFVQELPQIASKPKFVVLLNDIPRTQYDSTVENGLRSMPEFASITLSNVLHHSTILAAHPKHTGFAAERKGPYKDRAIANVRSVAHELATELGLK